jgi:tetratricopeptide (TPR) repeat protein
MFVRLVARMTLAASARRRETSGLALKGTAMGFMLEDIVRSAPSVRLQDPRGLATTCTAGAALDHVEVALEAMLSYFGDPLAALDAATAGDPAWVHPHTLKAALLLTMGEAEPAAQARDILAASERLLANANERERAHARAAAAAAGGDWEGACRRWEAILAQWPTDVAALLFAHLFDFYRGDALNLQRRPQRVLPAWSIEMPLYGYVLGMSAFGLEESGRYPEAEDAGRAALAVNRRDPWAVHAVTHVFEMQGRHHDGADWLASRLEDWAIDNGFAFHNWFHAALFQMEGMQTEAALATFDSHLAGTTDMALQRVDGTAVLWRLHLLGVDVRERFEALSRTWAATVPGFYAFNDVHVLLARLGAGDRDGLEAFVEAMAKAQGAGPSNRRMAAQVAAPLGQALLDYGRGRWAEAAQGLFDARDAAQGFGGSHAQRDILTLTLLDAAARAGERDLARHVLNEREPAKKATPHTAHWRARIAGRLH